MCVAYVLPCLLQIDNYCIFLFNFLVNEVFFLLVGVLWLSLQDVYGIRATALIFAKSTTTTTTEGPSEAVTSLDDVSRKVINSEKNQNLGIRSYLNHEEGLD